MVTNKHVTIRYNTLDKCFSNSSTGEKASVHPSLVTGIGIIVGEKVEVTTKPSKIIDAVNIRNI
jgi:hypothetical protein